MINHESASIPQFLEQAALPVLRMMWSISINISCTLAHINTYHPIHTSLILKEYIKTLTHFPSTVFHWLWCHVVMW